MDDGTEQVADDELLYRRIPDTTHWYDPLHRVLKPESFAPHKTNDQTGLSVYRAKLRLDGTKRREAGRASRIMSQWCEPAICGKPVLKSSRSHFLAIPATPNCQI